MRKWIKEKKEKEVRKCAHDGNETQRRFVFEMNNKGYHRNEINIPVHARAQ